MGLIRSTIAPKHLISFKMCVSELYRPPCVTKLPLIDLLKSGQQEAEDPFE